MTDVGIIGASGFTGAELLRLCAQHPDLDVRLATGDTQAGTRAADLYPSLAAAQADLVFSAYDAAEVAGLDLVFLGLPHGASQAIVPDLIGKVGHVVDLAADFRLHDPAMYPRWYGAAHTVPELLGDFAYGLPELFRDEIRATDHVATPGCYPTAAALALAPLVRAGAVETSGIIVDAASGVSGAGRPPQPSTTFCAVDEDFSAYGLLDHRHTPEMEQVLGASVLFTPHLAPMSRGILATCYARPTGATSTEALLDLQRVAYAAEPFVVVTDGSPSTKATLGSNCAHVTARFDERTGWVLAIAAIDNLTKGASGAAVQCANLLLDLPETTGLPLAGLYP
ncbi:MAG: N-acetyl-gamma-glutamyl-phosphate reductase [Actinomycetota bacterium]|nr:N-acetyl-gamma-glutamyl-phosphate reductase [Actinomycetota bacterium]